LKFGIYVNPKRPKIPPEKILALIKSAGLSYSKVDPDIAIVVGGDGTFGYYGRTLPLPLLFVGVKRPGIVSSKARLAEIGYARLADALRAIEEGRCKIMEKRMLSVALRDKYVDVLTDVYLERGKFAGCLRYKTDIRSPRGSRLSHSDYAIGNGVIVSSSFGAGGYFSYPDMFVRDKKTTSHFSDDRIGICHIIPTFLTRRKSDAIQQSPKVRYTIPASSRISIRLLRDAKARLYGTTLQSEGQAVRLGDTVSVASSKRTARIVKLKGLC
jgi:NAD+ kinase